MFNDSLATLLGLASVIATILVFAAQTYHGRGVEVWFRWSLFALGVVLFIGVGSALAWHVAQSDSNLASDHQSANTAVTPLPMTTPHGGLATIPTPAPSALASATAVLSEVADQSSPAPQIEPIMASDATLGNRPGLGAPQWSSGIAPSESSGEVVPTIIVEIVPTLPPTVEVPETSEVTTEPDEPHVVITVVNENSCDQSNSFNGSNNVDVVGDDVSVDIETNANSNECNLGN